jgi:hypothetical protein
VRGICRSRRAQNEDLRYPYNNAITIHRGNGEEWHDHAAANRIANHSSFLHPERYVLAIALFHDAVGK